MKDDANILFNLKCYLESLLASGQDKICYNDLLYDEKTIDCINAIEDLLKERKKYTIRLTDEEYRKVIENAQMDTSNDRVIAIKFAIMQQQINEKDKRIQELEAKLEFKKFGDLDNVEFEEYMSQFIPTQVVIDKIKENKQILDKTNDGNLRERLYIENGIMKELLEGERK